MRFDDLILAMDRQNLAILRERCPPQYAERLHLLLEFGSPREVIVIYPFARSRRTECRMPPLR